MSQAARRHDDPERGDILDRRRPQHRSATKQSSQPSQGESIYDDSSGPLFSMYSKVAEEEDNKTAERLQKDADGILIFTGLFSAADAALLAVSVQDLKPDPQKTSAFYLENIFQLLAEQNISRTSIPSKPPPFSPPKYAVWVNSLWFLSLVVSLTCALLAKLVHQWARRYVRNTQPPRCSPEKRARTRAFFSEGAEKLHFSRVVETLPTLVHLSLFLFFVGLLIFLFNTNRMVFNSVTWWIALFSLVYGWITLMPIFRHDSPYYAPLSALAWLLCAGIQYITFGLLSSFYLIFSPETRGRFRDSRNRYRGWISLRGRVKAAEETMSRRSSEIDLRILDWAIDALGEDDTVEKLFEAIPRFFRSSLVNRNLPVALSTKFWEGLDRFLGRTLLSNSVFESVKIRRVVTCMNATNALHGPFSVSKILYDIFEGRWGQALQSVETGYTLAHWCTSDIDDISKPARCIVASILARARKRTDRWVALAADQFGIPEHVLRDSIDHGDSVLLSILIHLTRKAFRDKSWTANILWTLSQITTRETLPRLQHEFCALWNEIVLEARDKGAYTIPLDILREIRHAYLDLHRGTDALPTAFSASTGDRAHILYQPSSYPLCDIAGHLPDSAAQTPLTSIRSLVLWSHATTFGGLNDASHAPIESQPLPTASLDVATIPVPQGTTNISTTSLTAHPIPPPISSTGNPPQTIRQLAIGPSVVSDSTPPPILMATLGSGIHVDPPSTVELNRIRSNDIIPHALGSPSSSRTYRHHAPQFASVSGRHVMLDVGTADAQHDAADMGSPTPMGVFHHLHPSASADPGISEKTSLPEDHQHDHD